MIRIPPWSKHIISCIRICQHFQNDTLGNVLAILKIDTMLWLFTDWFSFRADGHWSDWMHWSSCSATCGIGTKTRSRICNNPAPLNGGKNCFGNVSEMQYCDEAICQGLLLFQIFLFLHLYLRLNSMY